MEQLNSKVVSVEVTPASRWVARRGAMLGYSGQVVFRPLSGTAGPRGGVAGVMTGMLSGEANPMMAAEGQGSVLYGYNGLHVDVVQLTPQAPLTIEADRLLAYDHSIQLSLMQIGSGGLRGLAQGAMTGQGLMTSQLSGQGAVAILSHGGAIRMPVNGEVFIDPQAYVAHQGNVQVELTGKVGLRDAVGRGSGEAFKLRLTGQGDAYVQPSEQKF